MRVHVNQAVILKAHEVAGLFGLAPDDTNTVLQTQYALDKAEVLWVGLLSPQSDWDEDDDRPAVSKGQGICSPSHTRLVAIDDISTVN